MQQLLSDWISAFLEDRQARRLAENTLAYYHQELQLFYGFAMEQDALHMDAVDAPLLRRYLLALEAGGRNPGGQHASYRALKAFLRWYEVEAEPEDWKNPINKIQAPKRNQDPLPGAPVADIRRMVAACHADQKHGLRDRAALMLLLDSGVRRAELIALNVEDVDLVTGRVTVRHGKGDKARAVFVGMLTRQALREYLAARGSKRSKDPLFLNQRKRRLEANGVRYLLQQCAQAAGVPAPTPHDFRRAFALNYLRNGGNVFDLQRLMGHSDLRVLQRYLALVDDDLKEGHQRNSPVDRAAGRSISFALRG